MNFIDYLQTQYPYSERTLQDKQSQIENWKNQCLKNQTLENLTSKEVLKLIEIQKKKYKIQTLNNQIQTLEQYYNYLVETKKRKDHPIRHFRIKPETKPIIQGLLTEQELTEIYEQYPSDKPIKRLEPYRQRNKVILGLIIYQALDNTTLSKLEIQDIDIKKRHIKVPKVNSYKRNKRTLKLNPNQIPALANYLTQTRKEILRQVKTQETTKKLFPTSEKTKFSSITKAINKQIKIEKQLTLRYSRISLWIKQSNLIQAQYNAGYRSIKSLEKLDLTHLEKLKQDLAKYHPL
ncbi:site-specific integrase [Apibacter muscae]|uniref:tyrosine-type recombinase/integrase n=1 Tax=Apibacter muscae TaxID=2509004 RepID=UPI0011ABB99B|nr:site-specific integrase [Apibacter muscae]TWP31532.1 site-specific integrase [Apibacter muscae]